MLRIFLVEDESAVRESLRDMVPWNQYGYALAGEAGDGEMALPLIRQTKPDVLITDIRMPFMDGLALSELVSREFPEMKIVVVSGCDDFACAQRAIDIGVERYLLKPVSRRSLLQALEEIRKKIEGERASRDRLDRSRRVEQAYEQYARRAVRSRGGRAPGRAAGVLPQVSGVPAAALEHRHLRGAAQGRGRRHGGAVPPVRGGGAGAVRRLRPGGGLVRGRRPAHPAAEHPPRLL